MFNGEEFGKQIVAATKSHIDKTVAPLLKQIDALKAEIEVLKSRPEPKDGKDADQDAVVEAVASIITGNMRKDFEELRASVAAIPALPDVPALVAKAVEAAMPAPVDVKALVIEAVAALPPAKDGAKGDPGEPGPAGARGADGINGKDGADLIGTLMIDRKGALIHTMADGSMRDLGIVVGKDADMAALEGLVEEVSRKAAIEAVASIPLPKDGERGPQGEPGKSVTVDDVAPLIENAVAKRIESVERSVPEMVKSAVSAIPVPQAPQLPDIDAMVTKAVMALPPAQDGKDADPDLVQSLVKETVERAVAALPVAKDGKSVTIDDVRPLIDEAVTKAVATITVKDGVDGKDGVTLEELLPVIEDRVQKAAAGIPVPKDGKDGRDGIDVKDLLVVEGGDLVATFTDGRVKVLGPFRGKDGAPGEPGKDGADVDPQTVEKLIDEKIAKVSPPEIERDAYLADITKMIEEAVAKNAPVEEEEFAPDDVAASISLAVKMMAERPAMRAFEPEQKAQTSPTINIALSDNREPSVVNVAPPNITIEAKRSKEVTKVTGYDENGRIKSFEKTEVDE